ncbi:F-box protein SKIP24 [Forsythia ovata]|uniref:F-box protein SKIP24 n=1 Tax=Forsythia ovata TaxID=205694 RepID=A0ABD1R587_9LAMI
MLVLPNELCRRILELGIQSKTLIYKDLCCLSITCRRLSRLSAEDSLWSFLLFSDFSPSQNDTNFNRNDNNFKNNNNSSSTASSKAKILYKIRYEKDREQKRLAHRRLVLRIESEIAEHLRKIREIKLQTSEEKEKTNETVAELLNLRKIRQASIALNVWQPEIVRGRQKQMVQQCNVPVDSRINVLEMELRLCEQQIAGYDNALRIEKRRLEAAKRQLASVKYHPLQEFSMTSSGQPDEHRIRRKKLKQSTTM